MRACEQTSGLNMIQHGEAVHKHYLQLINRLESGGIEAPILQTIYDQHQGRLISVGELQKYHLYHDCGKPICLTIDENGKRHYLNHAGVSAEQYAIIFPDDVHTADLIANDMAFHTTKCSTDTIYDHSDALTLYFTAWAETYANAEMFGGTVSDSFKIKRSHLIQAGKRLLTHL